MALDYNRDIAAPSKVASGFAEYFPEQTPMVGGSPVGGMRESDHRRMISNYMDITAPLQDRVIQMDDNLARARAQDMAFKRSQIAFEKEKQEQALRSQYNDPEALNKIGEILETDKPPLQQRADILELGRRNPQLLEYNPTFATAYRTGLQQTETRAKIKDKEEAPQKAARATTVNMLKHSGTPEGIDAATQLELGEISQQDADMVLKKIQTQKLGLAKSQQKVKVRKDRLNETKNLLNTPKQVDIKDTAEYQKANVDERRSLDAAFENRGGKKYTDEYRLKLAKDLMYYTDGQLDGKKITLEEALNLPDLELYTLTDAAARQQEVYLQGTTDPRDTVTTPLDIKMGTLWERPTEETLPKTTR